MSFISTYISNLFSTVNEQKMYVVEGNIGSGKSTLLDYINSNVNDSEVIYEPLNDWFKFKTNDNKNILELFYNDTNRWAYTMQTIAFLTRLQSIQSPQEKRFRFVERYVDSDKKIFAENCYENKLMNDLEWSIYNNWFEWTKKLFMNKSKIEPDAIIYIKTDPKVSYGRIKKRNRGEESNISLEYITDLNDRYEKMIKECDIPVIILDGNLENDESNKILNKFINDIKNFIN
jgi:deoxyadenosine/deoxycytidine kinase